MTNDEYARSLIARWPRWTPEQRALVAAVLRPIPAPRREAA